MSCDKYRNMLPLGAAGDLGPEESRRLEDHLVGCSSCRDELALYSDLTASLICDDGDRQTDLERIRLENRLLRRMIKGQTDRRSVSFFSGSRYIVRMAASVALVVSGFLLSTLFEDRASQISTDSSRSALIRVTMAERSTISAQHRFSAAGLKFIARGRKGAGE